MRLRVTVEPHGPLLLGGGMDTQNVRETRRFVSGGAIRGAIAERILSRMGAHSNSVGRAPLLKRDDPVLQSFNQIFLDRPAARFGYLYPTVRSEDSDAPRSFPAPATAFACKRYVDMHPLCDALDAFMNGRRRAARCARCQARTERYRGFIGYGASVPRRPLLRVGMNRQTETAEDAALYVLDAIQPGEQPGQPLAFTGLCEMTELQWRELEALLRRFFLPGEGGAGWRMRIGSARARGLGETTVHVRPASPARDLDARLDAFQAIAPATDRLYFSLTARAPLLVYSSTGVPALTLSLDILRAYCADMPAGLEAAGAFVEQELSTGWSQAWGMPKPIGSAIAAGSVFVYSVARSERDGVLTMLDQIEANGLGERLGEGFGDLVACDRFHVQSDAFTKSSAGLSRLNGGSEL
jgi:CRISPR-associated protein Csx10